MDNEKRKIVKYMFDGDELKFWDEKNDETGDFDIIDLNNYIDWHKVGNIALEEMKSRYPKGTVFIDIDEE